MSVGDPAERNGRLDFHTYWRAKRHLVRHLFWIWKLAKTLKRSSANGCRCQLRVRLQTKLFNPKPANDVLLAKFKTVSKEQNKKTKKRKRNTEYTFANQVRSYKDTWCNQSKTSFRYFKCGWDWTPQVHGLLHVGNMAKEIQRRDIYVRQEKWYKNIAKACELQLEDELAIEQ